VDPLFFVSPGQKIKIFGLLEQKSLKYLDPLEIFVRFYFKASCNVQKKGQKFSTEKKSFFFGYHIVHPSRFSCYYIAYCNV